MTISSTEPLLAGPYNGNGATTVFNYAMTIFSESELLVFLRDSNGAESLQTLATDYTVSPTGGTYPATGGTISMVVPPPTGVELIILPDITRSQDRPFSSQSSITLQEVEDSLDKLTAITRQLYERSLRAVTVSAFDPGDVDTLLSNVTALVALEAEIVALTANLAAIQNVDANMAAVTAAPAEAAAAAASAVAALASQVAAAASAAAALASELDAAASAASIDATKLLPSGAVMHFAMNTAPAGWIKADGSTVSRTTYAALFAAIGTTFGVGDGSTTFGLPDLRGEFIRGWDDGRGVDAARGFGSAQLDQLQNFTGSWFDVQTQGGGLATNGVARRLASTNSAIWSGATAVPRNTTLQIDLTFDASIRAGSETRGRNVALLACIKV